MSHWFHRNPLKATGPQSFDNIKMVAQDVEAIKIISDLKQSRMRILELLPDPHHDVPKMETAMKLYYSLIRGFLEAATSSGGIQASKLRHSLRFRWTQSMLGSQPEAQSDAVFEVANLMMNFAFWHMKHSAMVAAKSEIDMEEAKKVHTSLRKAAGLIKFVQDTLIPQLVEKAAHGSDLDIRVISAYLNQCTAEAQEVTIARAIELKHNANLISSLSYETSKMFTTAADSLSTLDQKIFGHWRAYFSLKSKFYMSQAFNYQGEGLLGQDKCGEAIRSLKESEKVYKEALEMAREYSKTKGPGTQAKPDQHQFFRRLAKLIKFTLEKCERENGMIYHQKVPYDPPELVLNDKTFGLVSAEAYEWPATSPLWTAVAYAAFDIALDPESKEGKKKEKSDKKGDTELIKPVKEVEIKTEENQDGNKTETGCVIS